MPGYKLHKVAAILESRDNVGLYDRLCSHWLDSQEIFQEVPDPPPVPTDLPQHFRGTAEEMMYLDSVGYLTDDILVKLDRATMAVGLELGCAGPFGIGRTRFWMRADCGERGISNVSRL